MAGKRKAIFFDRDGVLNETVPRDGKPCSPRNFSDFRLNPEAATVILAVKRLGYMAIVVTNQPDIARGRMELAELERMHDFLRQALPVDEIRVCPHDDADNCRCRKPRPGMLLDAAEQWGLDLAQCWMVGDTWKDIDAGRAAGCRTYCVKADAEGVQADIVCDGITALPAILEKLPS